MSRKPVSFSKPPFKKGGVAMLAVLIFVALAGAFLGLRFKVFVLGPVIPIIGLAIIAKGVATDQASRAILLTLFAAILCLQVSYFISDIVGAYVGTTDRRPKPFRAVHTAIGKELKTFYAVTEELPPEMIALLKQMN